MVSLETLRAMNGSGHLTHNTMKNKDGTPLVARLNGKLKTWITQPNRFKQPMKYGLYVYFYITNDETNEWH